MPNSQPTHTCAAPGCQAVIGTHLHISRWVPTLMCLRHWKKVPVHERRAVNRTWRGLQADRRSRECLKEYRTAVQAAIDSLTTEDLS